MFKRMHLPGMKGRGFALVAVSILLAAVCASGGMTQETKPPASNDQWVGTWASAMTPVRVHPPQSPQRFQNQTIREVVHTSIGGTSARIRLSNTFGDKPLRISAAHIALCTTAECLTTQADRPLTFSGEPGITIPTGAIVLSDPVKLNVPALTNIAVSLYFAQAVSATSVHPSATQTSYVVDDNATGDDTLDSPAAIHDWPFLSGVDVIPARTSDGVVAFGDSITDGYRSTENANHRWPDFLAARLHAQHKGVAVLNEGIGGNRILHDGEGIDRPEFGRNALSRFDRDVLSKPRTRYLIVLEGINDIGVPNTNNDQAEEVSARQIIGGLRQLIERAHEHRIRVYGGTLTPIGGSGYFSAADEAKRQAVNTWIRTSGAFDAVIDFDAAIRDPNHPTQMLPAYDSGDHLHPNDNGYKAMADAIDLSLFSTE